jgi:hypothetical protein
MTPAHTPAPRGLHAMAYDAQRERVVLFGGLVDELFMHLGNDTWEYDGTDWEEMTPTESPPAKAYHALAYDSARGVTVMYGGMGVSDLGTTETWEYDGTTWTERTLDPVPMPLFAHGLAYHGGRGATVLFGGTEGSNAWAYTWEYDGTTWTETSPPISPRGRDRLAMAYLPQAKGVVLFGGWFLVPNGDTWIYRYGD